VPASHKHGEISSTSQTVVDSQPDLQGKKLHKRKRKHQEDVTDSQTHVKYQKLEHDDATSLEMNLPKAHHKECSSDGYSCNKKLLSDVQSSVNCERQKHKKKKNKKKKLHASASVSVGNETAYSTDYEQFHKRKKKKKKHKKTRCKEDVPQSDFSKDLPECSSSHLLASGDNEVCGGENVSVNTCEDSQPVLVNELENIGPDEMKYVENVYNEHKSSKSKHMRQNSNTDMDTEVVDLDNYPDVFSEASPGACSEVDNRMHTQKSVSEKCLNAANILQLLHADNSSYYLNTASAVKEAGKNLEVLCCSLISFSYGLMLTVFFIVIILLKSEVHMVCRWDI